MSDSSIVDRWNVIESAGMAVGVEGVLYRFINNKPSPFDFEESMKDGIDFLDEASNGGAIICGESLSSGFTGTLSPLRWSRDVYIGIEESQLEESEVYKNVVKTLRDFKVLLEKIQRNEEIDSDSEAPMKAHQFFGGLASFLMRQADPVSKSYSHQI